MNQSVDLDSKYEMLARILLDECEYPGQTVLYYVECLPMVSAPYLFVQRGEKVHYVSDTNALDDQVSEIWDALEGRDQWHSLRCSIINGRFEAVMGFEKIRSFKGEDDRRQAALTAVFGDKEVVYPDLSGYPFDDLPPLSSD